MFHFHPVRRPQNLGALRALASEGIQSGHMRLHAKNIAIQGGAAGDEIIRLVVDQMVREANISVTRAGEIILELDTRNK